MHPDDEPEPMDGDFDEPLPSDERGDFSNSSDDSPDGERGRKAIEGSRWSGLAFATAGITIAAFGTGQSPWALALSVALMGLAVLAFPPQARLPKIPLVCLLALCLAPLLSFLPLSWGGDLPEWRAALETNWDIQLSSTITPQPWVTLGAIVFLWLGALYWVANAAQAHGLQSRRLGIQVLTLGISAICLASVAEGRGWIEIPWWPRAPHLGGGFGPFLNRNHLATLASAGTVLAFGCVYDAIRRRSASALGYLLSGLPIIVAVGENTSRAGLLLTFIGLTSWIGFVAMRRGLVRKLAVGSAIVLTGMALVIVTGGSLAHRLGFGDTNADLGSSTRLDLYGECMRLFTEHPWQGLGLGNFDAAFNHLSHVGSPLVRYLHPESDFFQLLVEGGLPPFLAALGLILWFALSTGPWSRRTSRKRYDRLDRRLRQTAAIASGLMLLHALVDVPLHGIRFFTLFACISSFAIRPRKWTHEMGWPAKALFRAAGAGVIAVAAICLWNPLPSQNRFLGNFSAATTYRAAAQNASQGHLAEASSQLEYALNIAPLDWRFYWMRAQIGGLQGAGDSQAILDFGRARTLEPHYASMCFEEGQFWLLRNPRLAIPAWREYLQRDHTNAREGRYRHMIQLSMAHPEIRDDLWDLADTPQLKLAYLGQTLPPEKWNGYLAKLLAERPDLDGLSPASKMELFQTWNMRGDREQLMIELSNHPEWQEFSWELLADHLAGKSQFREAYDLATKYLPPPTAPTLSENAKLSSLESSFVFSPTDPRRGMELYWAQKDQGLFDEALVTLSKLEQLPQTPSYLPLEFASVYAAKGDYRKAWEFAKKFASSK